MMILHKQKHLTKLLHLLALDLQLLDELADFALLGQTLAVLHVTHVDVQPTCKATERTNDTVRNSGIASTLFSF